jgi:hypothetical protein
MRSGDDAMPKAGYKPHAQASAYFKALYADVNNASRAAPAGRTEGVKDNVGALETRMTLWDQLDEQRKWRWLFGFASPSVSGGGRHAARQAR